ncbi:GIY-YIG nuclease family protein [Oricola thermophila]|uniref:GIY-YIG nuclease family protein n=1 Tax=Oricola thermophila TaxID=2742145 RepID=UPI001FE5D2A1|nr:GIY-YIG nuclease family protein [Oricola thermophila]
MAALHECGVSAPPLTPADIEDATDEKGAYVLLVRLAGPLETRLPGTGRLELRPGWYAYCGSARGPGGLRARLRRHFRHDKNLHWHIDRLTVAADALAALPVPGGNECGLVQRLLRHPALDIAVRGFGSTDCRTCESHLLKFDGDTSRVAPRQPSELADSRKRGPDS